MSESETPPAAPWPAGLQLPSVYIIYKQDTPFADVRRQVQADTCGVFGAVPYDPDMPGDYALQISRLWPISTDLVLVDQDAALAPGAILHLAQCSEPWCMLASGQVDGLDVYGLKLVKFGRNLMRQYPLLMRLASRKPGGGDDFTIPNQMFDARVEAELTSRTVPRHHHTDGPTGPYPRG